MSSRTNAIGRSRFFANLENYLVPLVVPALVLVVWLVVASSGLVNIILLPKPQSVVTSLLAMLGSGELFDHIRASLARIVQGLVIGSVLGVGFGIFTGYFETFRRLFRSPIRFLRAVPIYAWIPMLILWFGIGETSKIIAISMGVFFPVHLNTEEGINNTDERYIEVAQLLQLTSTEIILKVILPGSMPFIFAGLRQGLSRACMVMVVAELIAATSGLGFLISDARLLFRPDIMIVGILTIGIIGLVLDQVISLVERRTLRWSVRFRQ